MSAVTRDTRSELQVLQAQKGAIKPLQPQAALNFALNLFEMFGQRFGKTIRPSLGKAQPLFDQVHGSFYEIQQRLANGQRGFTEQDCPLTYQLVDEYQLGERGDLVFFADLKERSYAILPFPQKALLLYQDPELGTIEKIEGIRSRAFHQMLSRLKIEILEDRKGDEQAPTPPRPLSAEDERVLTQYYYGGGAIVYDRRIVYVSEMVEMWKNFSPQNDERQKALLAQLSAREWGECAPSPVMAFTKYHRASNSFQKFLILCSIEAVQRNLRMDFSPTVAALMETRFEAEQTRSDFCYFSVAPAHFYELDMSKFDRNSTRQIRPFQLCLFITRSFGVQDGAQNSLLLILLHMDSRWDEKSLPSFCARRWEQPPLAPIEVAAFRTAWGGFQKILNIVAKRDVSFSEPTAEDEALFKNSECWDLLFFLWQNPNREFLIQGICELSKLPNFSLTLSSLLNFCKQNSRWFTPEKVGFFMQNYRETVQALQERGVEVETTHHIFFDPPLEILPVDSIKFGTAGTSAKRFVQLMNGYQFPKRKEYCLMLRHFVFHPHSLMFQLLKDAPAIGAEPTESLLWDALSRPHESFDPEPEPLPATRERAVEITRKIQEAYRFTDVQIFSLYLEVIRLVIRKEEVLFWKFAHIIDELVVFCPAVQKKDIYYLLRYHPNGALVEAPDEEASAIAPKLVSFAPEHVASLALMRDTWAKNEAQLNRFVVDQRFYNGVIEKIEKLVVPLSQVCPDEMVGNKFEQTLQFSLLSAFFPPFQPLMDYLRITNLTEVGPRWGEPSWRGHLGQLKFILGEANIGIYLNWSLMKGRPVLFLSFFDIKKQEAFSAFIPIEVPNEEIAPNRVIFYGLLLAVGSQVLREQAEKDVPPDSPEMPESWIPAFNGVAETLVDYPPEVIPAKHVEEMWRFFRRVKLSYRNLFLSRLANRRLPDFNDYEPNAIAAQGHIFSAHPRGSLLPKAQLQLVAHADFYLPDAAEQFVGACRPLFADATAKPEPLNLNLNMPDGKHPISYHVQTIDQVTGEIEHRRERNDTAPPAEMTRGRYVTLSAKGVNIPLRYPTEALENPMLFPRYFDYHNLLLKSAVYNA